MAGSVNKDEKTGKWYYILELGKDEKGKRLQKKKRGFKTKKEAQQALVAIENEVNIGTYVEPSRIPFGDYLEDWLKIKKLTIGPQTYEVYEFNLRKHIIPRLGRLHLSQVKTMNIQTFIVELADQEYASETIKKMFNIIRSALQHAYDMGFISENYATKVKLPRISKSSNISVWSKDEMNRFLKVAKEDRYFMLFHLALVTGLRRGELLGLRWCDINFEKSQLRVSQTLSRDGKSFLEGAKTKASVRIVPLPPITLSLLTKHRRIIEKEAIAFGEGYQNNDLVICTQIGTPLNPPNVRRTFKNLIKAADVPDIRFHDLRHTHATLLLSEGVNAKVISERLGHSSVRITLDIYSHVMPTMQQDAVDKISNLLG